ncbi:uncharacterized protein BO72DRAFT_235344 [Aspergillus fijiensis CBS 313.89]|uniref:Uncharacterized protein n=1 Tax=Aspergillus fijiensis CBS 313.89 TaxID=1448319 RepID=A0A8G1RHM0_9EURO|nr:uncharacterized protein BO72DRAFT_235344 [Aspergillus fijiensis CBS 313.89]RAK73505.1 hypothetical protein BO72DRAFT_235344 [Aspergillus fijiensis CBS 313.89]
MITTNSAARDKHVILRPLGHMLSSAKQPGAHGFRTKSADSLLVSAEGWNPEDHPNSLSVSGGFEVTVARQIAGDTRRLLSQAWQSHDYRMSDWVVNYFFRRLSGVPGRANGLPDLESLPVPSGTADIESLGHPPKTQ